MVEQTASDACYERIKQRNRYSSRTSDHYIASTELWSVGTCLLKCILIQNGRMYVKLVDDFELRSI